MTGGAPGPGRASRFPLFGDSKSDSLGRVGITVELS